MPAMEYELKPVSRITTAAIGEPGKRIFYLQASANEQLVTLIIEKRQLEYLAIGLEQFLQDLAKRHPNLSEASTAYLEEDMALEKPIEPAFRIGQIGLGYDDDSDLLVLMARELVPEEPEEREPSVARFWCTRSQLRAMCLWGLELASRGRPICGNCGQPIDAEGHFCPRSNGRQH